MQCYGLETWIYAFHDAENPKMENTKNGGQYVFRKLSAPPPHRKMKIIFFRPREAIWRAGNLELRVYERGDSKNIFFEKPEKKVNGTKMPLFRPVGCLVTQKRVFVTRKTQNNPNTPHLGPPGRQNRVKNEKLKAGGNLFFKN